MKAKKLIEVAMPIKEISAESVRDNRLAGGNIRTLHIWWARRPLPTCRAVIFASLVPDPLDAYCPQAFKDAVDDILMKDKAYEPYPDIPYTAVYDPMENNAIILCQCTAPDCSRFYHFIYYHSNYGSNLVLQEMPSAADVKFDKDIIEISQNFCNIYNQANKAEQCGLKEVSGIGYRKSLEFLIKDYLISIKPEKAEIIKKSALSQCINDYVESTNIKNVAKRAV